MGSSGKRGKLRTVGCSPFVSFRYFNAFSKQPITISQQSTYRHARLFVSNPYHQHKNAKSFRLSYKSCVFSSPNLQSGTSYNLYNGGNSTGTVTDGLYQNGTYTPGTLTKTFTANSIVTSINAP